MAGFSKRNFGGQLKAINKRTGGVAGLTTAGGAKFLPQKDAQGLMRAIRNQKDFFPDKAAQERAFKGALKWLRKKGVFGKPSAAKAIKTTVAAKGLKGAVSIKALGTLGAGALAVAAWALPAKRLGEEIGFRIQEKKAGKRLRGIKDVEVLQKKASTLVTPERDPTARLVRRRRSQEGAIKRLIKR